MLLSAVLLSLAPSQQEYIVAGPAELVAATKPLREHREAQGFAIRVIELDQFVESGAARDQIARTLQQRIHARIRASRRPGYLVLCGDAFGQAPAGGSIPTPSLMRPGLRRYSERYRNQSESVYSDLGYVDIDDDGRPEWSCGRLPCTTPATMSAMTEKIVAYDQTKWPTDHWRRDITLIALPGDLGRVPPAIVKNTLNRLLRNDIDPRMRMHAVFDLEGSPFHVAARALRDAVVDLFNLGSVITIYGGHGWTNKLAPVRGHEVFSVADRHRLRTANRTLFLAFACNVADLEHTDSIGRRLLQHPGGPCAVFAASSAAVQLGDALLAHEVMAALGTSSGVGLRIGDVFRRAKRALVSEQPDDTIRARSAELAALLGFDTDPKLRRYTSDVFHLLGDPAMRLQLPLRLSVTMTAADPDEEDLRFEVISPDGLYPGSVRAELCVDRGADNPDGGSNDVLFSRDLDWLDDKLEFTIPRNKVHGRWNVVRVFGTKGSKAWAGALRFRVTGPR